MLVQNRVGLNKENFKKFSRKGAANVLVVILLILIVMGSVFILWKVVNKVVLLSPGENCFNYIGFSLEDACYLSENEIKVILKRGFDEEDISKLSFSFFPSNSLLEITGEKCLDVRLSKNDRYGGYCDILDGGESLSYVFNLEPGQERVSFSVGDGNCFIGERDIRGGC